MTAFIRILLLSLLSLSLSAFAQAPESFDFPKMKSVLGEIRKMEQLPYFSGLLATDIMTTDDVVQPRLQEIFDQIQAQFFSASFIKFELCRACVFAADYREKKVFGQTSYIINLVVVMGAKTDAVLKYIFAHELSHFVHEISSHAPYSSATHFSINGHPSFFHSPPRDRPIDQWPWINSHSEVDAYAALVLQGMGFNEWDALLEYLDYEIKRHYDMNLAQARQTADDLSNAGE